MTFPCLSGLSTFPKLRFSILKVVDPNFSKVPHVCGPIRGSSGYPVLQAELVIGCITPLKKINRD